MSWRGKRASSEPAGGFGTVAAVAKAMGFASAKHFSNVYAERFGRRPSDYRPRTT